MSITETYYLAHTARQKLTREASRADHNLRLLVGHANLLDSLMDDLADAEQEQERWFNQTVSGATKASQNDRHIQWVETVVEDPEDDWDADVVSDVDSEDSDDLYEEDFVVNPPLRRRSPPPMTEATPVDEEDEDTDSDFEYDDEDDLEALSLTRAASRQLPPELLSDSDDDSDDDSMPPSPPQPTLDNPFGEKEASSTEIPFSDSKKPGLLAQGYYIAHTHREQPTLIESY